MARRLVLYVAGALAIWIVGLLIAGVALVGRTTEQIASRLGESLGAKATVGESDLQLVRGGLVMEQLAVRRDDVVGELTLDVAELDCDLPPLGLVIFDRACGSLVVRGVHLEVSTFALFKIEKPKRRALRAEEVVIEDATLVFLPSSMIPSLGRMQVTIEHAVAGPTTFKTPLSWLFALRTLRAAIELPAGITVKLAYADGMLTAAGSLFGSKPISLPVQLPVADLAHDGQAEVRQLVELGKNLAEELVVQRAKDWVDSKL